MFAIPFRFSLFAALAAPTLVQGEPVAASPLAESLAKTHMVMPLEHAPRDNSYYVPVQVNGKPGRFQLDTGAAQSCLNLRTLKKFGLTATESGSIGGVGGGGKSYISEYDSIQIGDSLKMGANKMTTLDMGGDDCDGVIGHDVFVAVHGVIDHGGHRFWFPQDGKPADIGTAAKAAGLVALEMATIDDHYLVTGSIGGKPLKFLLDNGAQQSVIDAGVAKDLGLRIEYGVMAAVGSSGKSERMGMASVDSITIGAVKLRRAPLAVVSLAGVQSSEAGRFDGILGAEFLFATKALLDVGNNRLYVAATEVDSRPHAKAGGEMFDSDATLKAACADSAWVGAVRITSMTVLPDVRTEDGHGGGLTGVKLEMVVRESFSGAERKPNEKLTVVTLCPSRPDLHAQLSGSIGRNPMKIVFLAPDVDGKPSARLMRETFWTDGDLPRAQIRRVLPDAPVGPFQSK